MFTNTLIMPKRKYQNFSYLVKVQVEKGQIDIYGAKGYQHKVWLNGKILQEANLKDINHLLIISENGKVVLTYREKEEYKYAKIVLSKKVFTLSQIFKKDFPQYKDNFPKQIIFLNKDKKPLMHVFFNEKGIIEKIVKINEEIIYQYNQN